MYLLLSYQKPAFLLQKLLIRKWGKHILRLFTGHSQGKLRKFNYFFKRKFEGKNLWQKKILFGFEVLNIEEEILLRVDLKNTVDPNINIGMFHILI